MGGSSRRPISDWERTVRWRWSTFLAAFVGKKRDGKIPIGQLDRLVSERTGRVGGDYRKALYSQLARKSTPRAATVWVVGQSLRDGGLAWCNGLVALFAAAYYEDFLRVLFQLPDGGRLLPQGDLLTNLLYHLTDISLELDRSIYRTETPDFTAATLIWNANAPMVANISNYDALSCQLEHAGQEWMADPRASAPEGAYLFALRLNLAEQNDFMKLETVLSFVVTRWLEELKDDVASSDRADLWPATATDAEIAEIRTRLAGMSEAEAAAFSESLGGRPLDIEGARSGLERVDDWLETRKDESESGTIIEEWAPIAEHEPPIGRIPPQIV